VLTKLPSNWAKKHPGKSAREIAALSKDQQASRLSEASINAYLVSLSSFFTWASNEGFAEGNPVSRMFVKDPAYFHRFRPVVFMETGHRCSWKPDSRFHDFGHPFSTRTAPVKGVLGV
jgi:hypothetical protein